MATANSLLMAQAYAATQGFYSVDAETESPVIWLRWLGATDAGATVAVAAGGDISFTTDGSTADTTVNTTGTIDCSTPPAASNILSEVVGLINASANWQAYLLGRPEDSSDNTIAVSAATDISTAAYKTAGAFLFNDAVVSYRTQYAISGFDPTKSTSTFWNDNGCISSVQWIDVVCDCSAAGYIRVYSCSQTASTLLWQDSLTDDTATEYGSTTIRAPLFQSRFGEHLLIQVVNDQDGTNDSIMTTGFTIDTANKRYVNGYRLTNALLA